MLDLAAGFVSLTALLAFVNRRFVGLPPTIGVMAIALVCSLLLHGLTLLGLPGLEQHIQTAMARVNFDRLLLDCLLSFLLFAGAMNSTSPTSASVPGRSDCWRRRGWPFPSLASA